MGSKRDSQRGLTDKKICVAVTVGILCGVLFALYGGKSGHSAPIIEGNGSGISREEYDRVLSEKESLEKEVSDLKSELEKKGQVTVAASSEVAQKAGPVGTVKSQRTNPIVVPDPSLNPELNELLEKIAINKELIVAISNNYIRAMLQTWFESIQRVGIKNYLVIALDDEVAQFCKDHGVPAYRMTPKISDAQKGTGDNHAISGLKFHFLREFLVLGYNVLLSDVDIVYLQNPFDHLYRDCDVESMTDGFDNYTAYGYDDVSDDASMGWARYAHTMRVWVFNSGLFYIRATFPSIELLDRVTDRLAKTEAWDQAVFNEELFFPSHPGYDGLHASTRVMDYYQFMNSKVLFKQVRKDGRFADHVPVTIHVNYHPEKHPRMLAIVEYYVNGNKKALDQYPDGSM